MVIHDASLTILREKLVDLVLEGPVNSGLYSIFNKLNKSFTGPSWGCLT
jgi:hypothetical protein